MFTRNRYNSAMTTISTPTIRAYLGGSFNPVHNAHIEMAMQVYGTLAPIATEQQYDLVVSLLPNARSPFKSKSTAPKHRLAMLKLAIQDTPLQIDELELWQTPPVYTIDSVTTLRQRYPHDILIFIMGMDSARSLDKWKQGLQLTDYVHLWIFDRHKESELMTYKVAYDIKTLNYDQTTALSSELPVELQGQVVESLDELISNLTAQTHRPLKRPFKGRIYINSRRIEKISSSDIRKQLFEFYTATPLKDRFIEDHRYLYKYLNPAVYHYIMQHKLYSSA